MDQVEFVLTENSKVPPEIRVNLALFGDPQPFKSNAARPRVSPFQEYLDPHAESPT